MDAGERAAAERWLKETGFIATVEAAVNKACQAMPDDPAGYVADRLLEVAASPTFIQFIPTVLRQADGTPQLGATALCQAHGVRFPGPLVPAPAAECVVEEVETEEGQRQWVCRPPNSRTPLHLLDAGEAIDNHRGVQTTAAKLATTLTEALHSMVLTSQQTTDEALWTADETAQKTEIGGQTIAAASLATAMVCAAAQHCTLLESLGPELFSVSAEKPQLPKPMALCWDLARSNSKLKFAGVYVGVKSHVDVATAAENLAAFAFALRAQLSKGKSAASFSPAGAVIAPADKLETLLDNIKEAATAADLRLGKDLILGLDCVASKAFDVKRNRYEFGGGISKTPDDWANELVNLSRDPSLGFAWVMDPFRVQDRAQWKLLREKAPDMEIVCNEAVDSDATLLQEAFAGAEAEEEGVRLSMYCSAVRLCLGQRGTLSRLAESQAVCREQELKIIYQHHAMSAANDATAYEVAQACGAEMIACGLPVGAEISFYTAMIQMEQRWQAMGRVPMPEVETAPEPDEEEVPAEVPAPSSASRRQASPKKPGSAQTAARPTSGRKTGSRVASAKKS